MIDLTSGSEYRIDIKKWMSWQNSIEGKNKSSLENLSDNLREQIVSFVPLYKKTFKNETKEDAYSATVGMFSSRIYILAHDILQYAVYARYITGGSEDLLKGLHTHGRLMYLYNIIEHSPENPISHGRHFLISAAGKDFDVLHAYVRNRPLLAKYTPSYIAALYEIIENDHSQKTIDYLLEATQKKTVNKHTKGKIDCVLDIFRYDREKFSTAIQLVLDNHHKSKHAYDSGLYRYISFDALALYTLADFSFTKAGLQSPEEPNHRYWDSEFWHCAKNAGDQREHIIDIKSISPILYRWLEELPASLDLQELVSSL